MRGSAVVAPNTSHRGPRVVEQHRVHAVAGGTLDESAQLRRPGVAPGPTRATLQQLWQRRRRLDVCGPNVRLEVGRTVARLAHPASVYSPSSRERRVAALTASRIAARIRADSSSRSPAAVVPPGEVTASRNVAGHDFCAAHGIACDIELIRIQQVNEAYERMLRSDVKYRFVIDMESLKS